MKNLKTRGMEASVNFLARKGYEVLEADHEEQMIVAFNEEEDVMVFAHVTTSTDDDFHEGISRKEFEQYAMKQLPNFGDKVIDKAVRFDEIALKVFGDDQAFLRHHINCLPC